MGLQILIRSLFLDIPKALKIVQILRIIIFENS